MPKLVVTASIKQKQDLIEAVRAEESLYDPKTAKLKPKRGVWGQVAARCGIKRGLMAKLMWKNIYQSYVKYKRNPSAHMNDVNSELFERMGFLDIYLKTGVRKHRNHHSHPHSHTQNLTVSSSKENEISNIKTEINDESSEVVSSDLNETTVHINEPTIREFTTIQYWNDPVDNSKSSTLKEVETDATLNHINQSCSEQSIDSEVESYEDIILPDAIANGTSDNSLKMFFDAMYASTSQMAQPFQRLVKSKVFAAVLEAEEQSEKQKSSASATSSVE